MLLRNTTAANLGVKSVTHPESRAEHTHMVVPGESTLWLDDDQWNNHFKDECWKLLTSGNLVIVEGAIKTEEEIIDQEEREYQEALAIVNRRKDFVTTTKPVEPAKPVVKVAVKPEAKPAAKAELGKV